MKKWISQPQSVSFSILLIHSNEFHHSFHSFGEGLGIYCTVGPTIPFGKSTTTCSRKGVWGGYFLLVNPTFKHVKKECKKRRKKLQNLTSASHSIINSYTSCRFDFDARRERGNNQHSGSLETTAFVFLRWKAATGNKVHMIQRQRTPMNER
jgi:hypothetical protein